MSATVDCESLELQTPSARPVRSRLGSRAERPIFGKIRYMSSDNTRRKLDLRAYLDRWADA